MLSNDKKKKLRSIAHNEKPLIIVGKQGITDTLLESFETSLMAHNLVKVSILKSSATTLDELKDVLVEQFSVEVISAVGRVLVVYRYHKNGRIIV
jgi:RNA-binding protein